MLVGFAAPRLMAFPDWDILSVLTPEQVLTVYVLGRNKKNNMSLVLRKPVFGVSDKVPHKQGCTTTEDS